MYRPSLKAAIAAAAILFATISHAAPIVIRGRVTDAKSGKGIAGAIVSDGMRCTPTDKKGNYTIKSDDQTVFNVFVVTPGDYEIPRNEKGLFGGYIKVDPTKKKGTYNFTLSKRETALGKYTVLFMGDPQAMSQRPHSIKSVGMLRDQLREYNLSATLPTYQIFLGDMVTNEIQVEGKADKFFELMDGCGGTSMYLPGNHDHVQKATTYHEAIAPYATYFGPYNYAVNIGEIHYIFLDDCAWAEKSKKHNWKRGLNLEARTFLKEDLKHVDKKTPVMICAHCPITRSYNGSFYQMETGEEALIEALQGRDVHFWYGHTHTYTNYIYSRESINKRLKGVNSVESHTVGRCTGGWSCSSDICRDGTPKGMVIAEIEGKEISWRFHSFLSDYPHDMNIYLPARFKDAEGKADTNLYCNIYMWDSKCSLPEFWQDGKMVGKFTRVLTSKNATKDPLYAEQYPQWLAAGIIPGGWEPSTDKDCMHLFSFTPSEQTKRGEVHYTDRFGRKIVREVEW